MVIRREIVADIDAIGAVTHFQARALSSWTTDLAGTFRYAKPFAEL